MYSRFYLNGVVKNSARSENVDKLVMHLNSCIRFCSGIPAPESQAELAQYMLAAKHRRADYRLCSILEVLKKIYQI